MLNYLKGLIHPRKKLDDAIQAAIQNERDVPSGKSARHPLGELVGEDSVPRLHGDPLEYRNRHGVNFDGVEAGGLPTVEDFPREEQVVRHGENGSRYVGDSKLYVGDSQLVSGTGGRGVGKASWSAYGVPEALMSWYASQSFIGYQACALIAQHWLIDKACTMPGEDAVRNGYAVTVSSEAANPGEEINPDKANEIVAKLQDLDNDYNITDEMIQFWRFTQIYGIRVAVFAVESDDPKYYEKPFNIDGVSKGSYKGIRQIDPYWMMPVLGNGEASDPTNAHFYDPSFWIIAGKKYHRSHLIIGRGPQPADILKPSYIFGGIPLVQRIYERVYAAERTANEGPLLAMTKRTTVLKTNLTLAETQPKRFMSRIMKWTEMRDNYGVKTVNTDDNVEQHDTSLADLDKTIMNQYQLVAAQAKVPSVKLLGTSPSGFNSSGEQETKSYHEHLESVQKFLSPLLIRHHELLGRSVFGEDLPIKHTWNRVDSFTAMELADLNLKKAQTGEILVTTIAAISPDDERNRLKNDPLSGYGHLGDEEAETEIGATPENEQGMIEAQAKETSAVAKEEDVNAAVSMESSGNSHMDTLLELASVIRQANGEWDARAVVTELESIMAGLGDTGTSDMIGQALPIVQEIYDIMVQVHGAQARAVKPGVMPSVEGESTVKAQGARRIGDGNQVGLPERGGKSFSHRAMPTHKISRMTVTVENPTGSIRSGVTLAGEHWRNAMPHDYGFINGTKGADGDEVDAFVGPDKGSPKAYIINQIEPTTGKFDEHKVMLGFTNQHAAMTAYDAAYQKGWKGRASVYEVSLSELQEWLREDDLSKPYLSLYRD